MEYVKRENERILRAHEELNQILIEYFKLREGEKELIEKIQVININIKRLNRLKMKAAHLQRYLVINVISIPLVIVVMTIIILKKENINPVRKFLGSLNRLNHQHSMERLRRGWN